MTKHTPAMEPERERKTEGKEEAPIGARTARDTALKGRKRTKQETKVRMSPKLPPLSPRAERSIPSPEECFDNYEEHEEGADL